MKNENSIKRQTIILCSYAAVYVIVSLLSPRLSFLRHTPLSLWIQAINYMFLGIVGLIAFRDIIQEGIRQWRLSAVKNLLWLIGAFLADIILGTLASLPLAVFYPDYVSVNDSSVMDAAAILPFPILLIAFGILGPVTEEFMFRIIPVEKGKRIHVVLRIIVSSFLFMAIHMHDITLQELLYNLGMFVTGIIYSVTLIQTKNATIPILIHVLNNAPALMLLLLANSS
ncbi:MAG: CPBP family intramembrane metalloprotease [Lachnospiraceae bacterium]|nr:CPBP family intramembrane metalloprotease [Lachnospiraceae bacterium]